jgi:hypothetical protein
MIFMTRMLNAKQRCSTGKKSTEILSTVKLKDEGARHGGTPL